MTANATVAPLGTPEELRGAVRARYSSVAREPRGEYNFRVGRNFAEALGYSAGLLDELPESLPEAFTGVACPSLIAAVQSGQTVVDLGSGGGLDLVILARKVGSDGHAIGIDFAPEMVDRARRNLAALNLHQAEVREASAEETGLPDAMADWVVINGLLNLAPDKNEVLREIARILKPGGRLILAETTLRAALPANMLKTIDDWFR